MPNVEYFGIHPKSGLNFSGYEAIEGEALTSELISGLDKGAQENVVQELAQFLKELRRFSTNEALNVGVPELKIETFIGGIWRTVEPKLDIFFTEEEKEKLSIAFRRYLGAQENFTYTPSLVHADLRDEHILFDARKKKLAGVIDWSDMRVTDPTYEIQRLYQDYGEAFTRDVLQAMGANTRLEMQHASFFTIARNLDRFMRRFQKESARAEKCLAVVKSELSKM